MARFITLSATTASVTSGGGTLGVDVAVTGGASLLRIVKIKVSFSAGTGNSTFEIFTKDTKLAADRIYIAEDFNVTLHDFADTSSGTAAEFQEGASIVEYEDEDASGEVHLKFTNDDSVNKTYTYTLLVEECPLFDSNGKMTLRGDLLVTGGDIQLGGTSSSFPMLQRSAVWIHARLADDSAFTNFAAASILSSTSILYLGGETASEASLRRSGARIEAKLGDGSGHAGLNSADLLATGSIVYLGGSSSSEVSLRRSGTAMRSRLGDDSAYADFEALDFHAKGDNYFFGGTTASYPMLKRVATEVQIRLGDDSDFADVNCENLSAQGSIGANQITGTIVATGGATGTFANTVTVVDGIVTGGT